MANRAIAADHLRTTFRVLGPDAFSARSGLSGLRVPKHFEPLAVTHLDCWQSRPGAPPGGQQKTAGRAGTLRSGSVNSWWAIEDSYPFEDSRASAVLVGGEP